MLTCKEASRLLSESCDRRLGLRERLGLRLHLLLCEACANFARHLRFLRRASGQAAGGEHAPGSVRLSSAARRRIGQALRREH